jgi:hypothetical protein
MRRTPRSKWSKGAKQTIPDYFVARLVEMMNSSAWRTLSLSARRLLDFLDIENRRHGGKRNGQLIATFEQLAAYGMADRHCIAPAIREAVALGFLVVTRQGVAGNADERQASQYRLTYHPAEGVPGYGSNEWRTIATIEEANRIATAARKTPTRARYGRPAHANPQKIKRPVGETAPRPVVEPHTGTSGGNHTEKTKQPSAGNDTTIDISAPSP